MATMIGNPTGSVGEPGGIRQAAMAKAAGNENLKGLKGGVNAANPEAREDLLQQRAQRQSARHAQEAREGHRLSPSKGGGNPREPAIAASLGGLRGGVEAGTGPRSEPNPNYRPKVSGQQGGRRGNKPGYFSPYGSHRNYPQSA